jgi:hypothetical protein
MTMSTTTPNENPNPPLADTPGSESSADWETYDDGPPVCQLCDGQGEIMVCIDDICHGLGECIHGDGYATCPDCKGSGEYEPPNTEVSSGAKTP